MKIIIMISALASCPVEGAEEIYDAHRGSLRPVHVVEGAGHTSSLMVPFTSPADSQIVPAG